MRVLRHFVEFLAPPACVSIAVVGDGTFFGRGWGLQPCTQAPAVKGGARAVRCTRNRARAGIPCPAPSHVRALPHGSPSASRPAGTRTLGLRALGARSAWADQLVCISKASSSRGVGSCLATVRGGAMHVVHGGSCRMLGLPTGGLNVSQLTALSTPFSRRFLAW